VTRREFAACSFVGSVPFFHRRQVELAGIRFNVRRGGPGSRRYLHIHGDEPTAREVLNIHMEMYPGIAYLVESQTRNVTLDGLQIDPNRLFSRAGAEQSLRDQNAGVAPEKFAPALLFLDRHREDLIRHLEPKDGNLLFAIHNNREYSVTEEIAQSDGASIKEPHRPREFFLCTEAEDFAILRQSPYNVVFQNRKPTADDGSLSRLAVKRGFRYVNLECGLGQFEAQLERVRWLEDHLK